MQTVHTNHLFNMHKTQFSLIVLVLLNVYGNRAVYWYIENSELLVLHNAYRRDIKYGNVLDQPKADSMLKLQWSHKLAKLAQAWAFHCVPTRSNLTMRNGSKWTYVGQNIAVVSKVRDAVSVWFNEHMNYNFNKNICRPNKTCANYKQLAFADTTHIGCGFVRCKNLEAPNNILVVCNYGPGGKYINKKPYEPIFYEDLPYFIIV
ncbi:unnamed protein product [Schistosoma intercalatum]|nr:unnamed protein product [Schistosoma intercalatum]